MKKILFVSGEPSGDHSGSYLVRELKNMLPDLDAYGVGGPDMEAAGLRLIHNITELSVIGVIEVIKHYPRLRRVFYDLLRHVDEDKPDAVVLIDYPGFNLRLAKKIKKKHPDLPIIYFISPQIWAWGHRRIYTIRRVINLMLVMFPFEVDVYEKGGQWQVDGDTIRIKEHTFWKPSDLQTKYVGHWITGKIEAFIPDPAFLQSYAIPENRRYVALLPGSRDNEIKRIFPVMIQSAEKLRKQVPGLFFLISCARPGLNDMITDVLHNSGIPDVNDHYRIIPASMYDIVTKSDIALVASGTAAFEAALLGKPLLVLYRLNYITIILAGIVVKLPFINLANIIAGRRIVPEFIQHKMTPERIVPAAMRFLTDNDHYTEIVQNLNEVHEILGHGDAGVRAAEEICRFMRWTHSS
jgi:lipid-A-disaccharide synthase